MRFRYLQSSSNKPALLRHPVCNSVISQGQNIPFRLAACRTWLSVCTRYHEYKANSESTELKLGRVKFSFVPSSCLVATPDLISFLSRNLRFKIAWHDTRNFKAMFQSYFWNVNMVWLAPVLSSKKRHADFFSYF